MKTYSKLYLKGSQVLITIVILAVLLVWAASCAVYWQRRSKAAKAQLEAWEADPRASAMKLVEELREQAFAEAERITAAARESIGEYAYADKYGR